MCFVPIVCVFMVLWLLFFFFFKHKTAYDMRISDWSSDVCSSDLAADLRLVLRGEDAGGPRAGGLAPAAALAAAAGGCPGHQAGFPRAGVFPAEALRLQPQSVRLLEVPDHASPPDRRQCRRSEEHTSELQSLMRISYAVFCLKKK